jgi:hypothetical protein
VLEKEFDFDYGTDYVYAGGGIKGKYRSLGMCNLSLENGRWILSVYPEDDYYSGRADITEIITSVTSNQTATKQEIK